MRSTTILPRLHSYTSDYGRTHVRNRVVHVSLQLGTISVESSQQGVSP